MKSNLTTYKLDKVESQHKIKSNIESGSCDESKLIVEVGIHSKNHPSQMKSNPTLTPQLTKPEEKVLSAAHLNNRDEEKNPPGIPYLHSRLRILRD